jgi:hypothetical protein
MPASRHETSFSEVDIDPRANLAIHLYLRDGSQMLPESPREADAQNDHPRTEAYAERGQQGRSDDNPARLTLGKVSRMSLKQLDRLQDRVGQMEVSNHGLLTRIYGHFSGSRRPFPLLVTCRTSDPNFPERGSPQHRQLLFSQYKKMVAILQDPTQCSDIVEPTSLRGARALQDYQIQLLQLADQRRALMKRKYQGRSISPHRAAPIADPGSLKAMRENCGVLDFDPRPVLTIDYRNDGMFHRGSAVADYQQQLKLLEEQNRKRLLMARQDYERNSETKAMPMSKPEENDLSSLPFRLRKGSAD